jgi:protein TonB
MKINLISEWGNVVSNVRNNIVFEHRNQAYGAYFIRREYPRTMFLSLFVTIGLIASGVVALKVAQYLAKEIVEVIPSHTGQVIVDPIIIDPPIVEPVKVDPTPPTPPQKGGDFLSTVIIDDDVIIENKQVTQDEDFKLGTDDGVVTNDDDIIIPETPKGDGDAVVIEKDPAPFTHVEEMPEFIGGEAEMLRFINTKLKYPKIELENNITGTVYASFVVDKSGNITNVKIERGVKGGPNFNKEVERVINLMPKWKPGKQNGVAVPVQFYLPVKFETR